MLSIVKEKYHKDQAKIINLADRIPSFYILRFPLKF